MIKVKANIKLYKSGRITAFRSGYRPLFNFIKDMKTSGLIFLVDRFEFNPGDEGEVEINFINKMYLGDDFGLGKKFTFGEGIEILGEGEIIEILKQ
jgi:translation elongation factor EF-Tu-like GTPase